MFLINGVSIFQALWDNSEIHNREYLRHKEEQMINARNILKQTTVHYFEDESATANNFSIFSELRDFRGMFLKVPIPDSFWQNFFQVVSVCMFIGRE